MIDIDNRTERQDGDQARGEGTMRREMNGSMGVSYHRDNLELLVNLPNRTYVHTGSDISGMILNADGESLRKTK